MSLRALGLNLTRRLFSRWNPRAQAVSSQRIVPQAASVSSSDRAARSFHTVRDLEIVGGGGAAAGVAAFVGLVGILFFKERSDGSAGGVTDEEVPGKKPVTINEASDRTYEGLRPRGAKWQELELLRRYQEMDRKKDRN